MKFKKTFLFLASQKMDINGSNLVLEKDGTEITDDEILLLLQQETLMVLDSNETWTPALEQNYNVLSTAASSTSTLTYCSDFASEFESGTSTISVNDDNEALNGTLTPENNIVILVPPNENNAPKYRNPSAEYSVSTQNSEYRWENYDIPWEKVPSYFLKSCENGDAAKAVVTQMINTFVGEMRGVQESLPRSAFRCIARKMAEKYPKTFLDVDEDGVVLGNGLSSTLNRLIERNNYLNRPHKRLSGDSLKQAVPAKMLKTVSNLKAGCSNWQPPSSSEKDDKDKNKKMLATIDSKHPDFYTYLQETYPEQRLFLNSVDNPVTVQRTMIEWPILFNADCILWHFKKLTKVEICELSATKISKILKFGRKKQFDCIIEDDSEWLNALKVLATHFKEDISMVVYKFEVSF